MKFRLLDVFWLTMVVAFGGSAFLQILENRSLKALVEQRRVGLGKALLSVAADGNAIPVQLLEQPFDSTLRYGGGMTLGPLVVANGDCDAASILIESGVDLRTRNDRNDGIESAIVSNCPKLVSMVLRSGQWRPSEVRPYLELVDQHRFVATGEGSENKQISHDHKKEEIRKLLLAFVDSE